MLNHPCSCLMTTSTSFTPLLSSPDKNFEVSGVSTWLLQCDGWLDYLFNIWSLTIFENLSNSIKTTNVGSKFCPVRNKPSTKSSQNEEIRTILVTLLASNTKVHQKQTQFLLKICYFWKILQKPCRQTSAGFELKSYKKSTSVLPTRPQPRLWTSLLSLSLL